jgi:zinc protease
MAALVTEEIAKLAKDGPTARELARSLNSRRAEFLDRLASVLGKSDQLAAYDYSAGTPDFVQQDLARYERITAADVQRVATQYLTQPKVVLTVVPDGKRQLMVGGTK